VKSREGSNRAFRVMSTPAVDPELLAALRRFPSIRLDDDTPTTAQATRGEPLRCAAHDCQRAAECVVILRTGKRRPVCLPHGRVLQTRFAVRPLPRCEWRGCDALATRGVELGPSRARALRVVVCAAHRDALAAAYADCVDLLSETDEGQHV
jgi:hypothetical protein